ncbi:hypothetical protein VKT23_002759 [Stygiomarasmius scandens]|uniref:Uncharacterized protein n=1 Tax=Marasmiellus scandens TaxID=2682957 RepID=A0ABR1JVP7_9AGAR
MTSTQTLPDVQYLDIPMSLQSEISRVAQVYLHLDQKLGDIWTEWMKKANISDSLLKIWYQYVHDCTGMDQNLMQKFDASAFFYNFIFALEIELKKKEEMKEILEEFQILSTLKAIDYSNPVDEFSEGVCAPVGDHHASTDEDLPIFGWDSDLTDEEDMDIDLSLNELINKMQVWNNTLQRIFISASCLILSLFFQINIVALQADPIVTDEKSHKEARKEIVKAIKQMRASKEPIEVHYRALRP